MAAREIDRVSLLLDTYLFADLTPAELEPLARAATIRRAVRGEHIFHVGDPADEIVVVASGELKDAVYTEDGDEVVHSLFGRGMVFGEAGFFAPERNRVMAMIALEPCTLLVLRRVELAPFLQRHPQVMLRALEGLSSVARSQTAVIAALARRPLPERLLLCLLDLVETNAQTADDASVTPRVSQATLAAMVGASRENVNRALGALAAEGTVRLEAGRYVIADPDGVRRAVSRGWPLLEKRNRRSEPGP
jgi:CRP-like cAMP-binding protein